MAQQAPKPLSDVAQLQDSMRLIDGLSQDAFSQIDALSKVSLKRLEDASAIDDTETLAQIFECIREIAQCAMNNINCEAEERGANSVDAAQHRRYAAKVRRLDEDRAAFLAAHTARVQTSAQAPAAAEGVDAFPRRF